MKSAEDVWIACAESLRSQVSEATWKMWFDSIRPMSFTDGDLSLSVPSVLVKERLEGRYISLVNDALVDAGETGTTISIQVEQSPDETIVDISEFNETPLSLFDKQEVSIGEKKHTQSSPLNPEYNFENFVIGASNRFAHAAALSVAETPAKSYNPLFIHGDSGLGKTHLLHAIGNYVTQNFHGRKVRYVSTETFINEFVEAIRTNATGAFKKRYRECDVLLIDDIQFIENKEGLQNEFFHTFNHLYSANKQIVISSDRHAKALVTLTDRLRSRFLSGLITDIQAPDLETRMAILFQKSATLGTVVPDDVHQYIAMNVTNNIRELEGALIRISAYASLRKEPITLQSAEQILADLTTSGSQSQTVTAEDILKATSEMFGFTIDDLCGSSRRRPLVTARQVSMYVFRELTNFSYPAIAKEFGGRDHTTVIHAVEKITSLMFERGQIYNKVTELIHRVKSKDS